MVGIMSAGGGKLSQMVIDDDLVMGAHAITIDAGGLIDGKDVSTLSKICLVENFMGQFDTEYVNTGGGVAWVSEGKMNLLSPLYVPHGGVYSLRASLRCKCDNAAREWRVSIDGKNLSMGSNTSGVHTVLTAVLATQTLTAGWKTVRVWHNEDSTSRAYRITSLNIALVEE